MDYKFEWWHIHGLTSMLVPISILSLQFPIRSTGWYVFNILLLIGIPIALLSYVATYKDAKLLAEREANWQPGLLTWIGAGIILTPVIVSPLYLAFRYLFNTLPKVSKETAEGVKSGKKKS